MSDIISHADWMSQTNAGVLSTRSSELKAVDAALLKYHQTKNGADKQALTAALLRWMQSKGAGWKTSARNRHHAVERLYRELTGIGGTRVTGQERVALSHMRDESRAIVEDLFAGKRLEWRSSFKAKLGQQKIGASFGVKTLVHSANTLSGGGGGGGMALAENMFKSLVPPEILIEVRQVLASLMPEFMGELAVSLTPFVGVLNSGASAVWGAATSLRSQWNLEQARKHAAGSLSTAEPAAALEALIQLLKRERNRNVFSMGVALADFGGKLAGVLADGGTATNAAIGIASSVVKLTNIIRIIVQDVLEKNAANRAMSGRVDISIFRACPIMGAYFVCCVPSSVLVNVIFEERFGQAGWQDEVEIALKRHHTPLKEEATRLVDTHRFWIPALANYPGLLKVNTEKLDAMLARKGTTAIGRDGFGSDNLPAALRS